MSKSLPVMLNKVANSVGGPAQGILRFHDYGIGEFDARHRIGPAYWPHFDLLAIHSGAVEILFEQHGRIELPQRHAVLIYPNTRFSGKSLVKMSRASVQHFSLINQTVAGYPLILGRLDGRRGGFETYADFNDQVLADMERAIRMSHRRTSATHHIAREAILLLILSQLAEDTALPEASPRPDDGIDFSPLTAWVAARLDQAPSLNDMAKFMGFSTSHFRAMFTRQLGCAPIQYVHRLRHIEACRLLRETAMPIKAIARRNGYDDPAHFYRFFKTSTSYTPAAYRRIHRVKG